MKNECYYNDFSRKEGLAFESKAVHGALGCDPVTGSVSFPIFQTATFRHRAFDLSTGYDYSRVQNPTRQELERTMAILDGGLEGFAFSSGQAAGMCLFSLLEAGDHVILSDDIYGGTYRNCNSFFTKFGCEFTYADTSEIDAVKAAIRPETKMIFVETPTNPMMKVADIRKIAALAKENGAIFVVDNTFLSPYFQRPLELGADVVLYSGTKYLAGHNDTIAGFLVTNRQNLADSFRFQMMCQGNGLASLDSWLVLRGIKTLPLRMEKHNSNAMAVAKFLRGHKKVKKIYYVGFEDHKDYAVTVSQTSGFGGMISFELDSEETAKKLLSNVKMILFAESLGGVESLVTYPLTQTHASIPPEVREKLGINERFIRLSVGIENADDIIADLDQALAD